MIKEVEEVKLKAGEEARATKKTGEAENANQAALVVSSSDPIILRLEKAIGEII